ncbi:DUF4188 domain-containing protein [Nocardiopsis rhodophaea]|uniref:DUF4188 domain-containing protein n=1 Tax=Nocardiopsis rhodophaea TaxID=280238 RepID=A0ABN2TDB2_9ACTN
MSSANSRRHHRCATRDTRTEQRHGHGETTRADRTTNQPRDNLTVFVLGLHVNAWHKPHRWLRAARHFRQMLAELEADPALGLLHSRNLFSPSGVTVIQYWESTAALMRYAHAATHTSIWRDFYRDHDRAVGIWHETYEIGAPQSDDGSRGFEAIYGDVPALGLGAALGTRPITRMSRTAPERLFRGAGRTHDRTVP